MVVLQPDGGVAAEGGALGAAPLEASLFVRGGTPAQVGNVATSLPLVTTAARKESPEASMARTADTGTGPRPAISHTSPSMGQPRMKASRSMCQMILAGLGGLGGRVPDPLAAAPAPAGGVTNGGLATPPSASKLGAAPAGWAVVPSGPTAAPMPPGASPPVPASPPVAPSGRWPLIDHTDRAP